MGRGRLKFGPTRRTFVEIPRPIRRACPTTPSNHLLATSGQFRNSRPPASAAESRLAGPARVFHSCGSERASVQVCVCVLNCWSIKIAQSEAASGNQSSGHELEFTSPPRRAGPPRGSARQDPRDDCHSHTTLMLQRIVQPYEEEALRETLLDLGLGGTFDLVYVPRNRKGTSNLGCAWETLGRSDPRACHVHVQMHT